MASRIASLYTSRISSLGLQRPVHLRPLSSSSSSSSLRGSRFSQQRRAFFSRVTPSTLSTASSSTLRLGAFATGFLALTYFLVKQQNPIQLDAASSELTPGRTKAPSLEEDEESSKPFISLEELERHTSREEGVWVAISGQVWDVTDFLDLHPGGSKIILANAGKDATRLFLPIHPPNTLQTNLDPNQLVGQLDDAAVEAIKALGPGEEEKRIKRARAELGHVDTCVNIDDFEKAAEKVLSKQAWAYYSSAADDETARDHAHTAYGRILFRPRVLRKVRDVSTATKILGQESSLPIFVSPAALARLGDPEGERNITRGAAEKGIVQVISSFASCSLDELNDVRKEGQPLFWQFYVAPDRVKAEETLRAAIAAGMNSIWLTVDAPQGGKREKDQRLKIELDPPSDDKVTEKGGSTSEKLFAAVDPNLAWEDITWIRKIAPDLPLVIKGVQCVEDAVMCVEHKVDGIVLSNHGGRQLEYSRPPIDVLQEIRRVRPDVLTSTEVFIDGGVKRGTDVLKALCLGAKGVGMGRPFLYAQSAWQTDGVVKVIDIMEDEIKLGMRLLGVTSIDQLGPEYLECLPPSSFRP